MVWCGKSKKLFWKTTVWNVGCAFAYFLADTNIAYGYDFIFLADTNIAYGHDFVL